MLEIKVKPDNCSKCPFYSVEGDEESDGYPGEIDNCAIQDGGYWFKDKVGTGQMFQSVSTCPLKIVDKIVVSREEQHAGDKGKAK